MIVQVRGLTKSFGARQVLRGIDADVRHGDTVALVGPSGGGKSTFLRCLNGLVSFDAGTVEVAGLTLAPGTRPDSPALRPLRGRVGMVFQGFHLFPHLTALENVALAPVHVKAEPRDKAEKKAAALPPKLTVPMILFFLPVLFVVILGPTGIKITELH
jgi:ABC-type polar amino acid transport system ATPase subunit